MTPEARQKLRATALVALESTRSGTPYRSSDWELQTSNSFRRIGVNGDGDVLCALNQRDGHPDLHAARGVLDFIIAAQPLIVLEMLDMLDEAEKAVSVTEIQEHWTADATQRDLNRIRAFVEKVSSALKEDSESAVIKKIVVALEETVLD